MADKCVTKHCRGSVALTYLGKPMCQSCYEKACDKEDAEYQYKNKCCPVCNKKIDPYHYTLDKKNQKVHLECAV